MFNETVRKHVQWLCVHDCDVWAILASKSWGNTINKEEENQNKNTTQYVLDTTIHTQANNVNMTTGGKDKRTSFLCGNRNRQVTNMWNINIVVMHVESILHYICISRYYIYTVKIYIFIIIYATITVFTTLLP